MGWFKSNSFMWKLSEKSPLTIGLLDRARPEIELSDYHVVPSPQSESPSAFLDGESFKDEPVNDLDLFYEGIYNYYCQKGLWCIIVKRIVELLCLAFTICFSGFFLLYVDWYGLRNAKCGMVAVESGIRPCDLYKEALHHHPLVPFTLSKAIIVGYLVLFTICWIFCFLRFFAQLNETLKIRQFYLDSLHVTDNELQMMPWPLVLEKIVQFQRVQQIRAVRDLSVHSVLMRLMRKENYLIGMLNKGILAFPIYGWVPGAGPLTCVGPNGAKHRLLLPKALEWTLNWCILQNMFNRSYHLRNDLVSDPEMLKKRLRIVGFVMLLLSPFLAIFMLVYLFLKHAEHFYNHPSLATSRRWSNLSKWMFREFNEVEHLFKDRMNSSVEHASNYLKQFPAPILSIIAKFISVVSGGFTAVLIIIAFLEESLLEGHVFGRNLFWYAAVFGTITAISRAAIAEELLILNPQSTMSLVVHHTHYMPKRWRRKESTDVVQKEFGTLFQYTGMMMLEEMASIFITPYLLIFVVPQQVDVILQFIVDFTVDVEGIGHVCRFSSFDFKNHGNIQYGSPFNSPRNKRSSQGKMEKSFLSFRVTYPSWEPDPDGIQFMSSVRAFQDRNSRGNGTIAAPHDLGNLFGSIFPTDVKPKNLLYILDLHYTSHNHDRDKESTDFSIKDKKNLGKTWTPSPAPNEARFDGVYDGLIARHAQSPIEASTSNLVLQESVLKHQDLDGDPNTGPWWARRTLPAQEPDLQTSFLEPPKYFQEITRNDDSRVLSHEFYIDDSDTNNFNIPFDGAYRRALGETNIRSLV